jgi:hypothetical protein
METIEDWRTRSTAARTRSASGFDRLTCRLATSSPRASGEHRNGLAHGILETAR